MTAKEWKIASRPVYIELLLLDEIAMDNGLNKEQSERHRQLKEKSSELLREYLRSPKESDHA